MSTSLYSIAFGVGTQNRQGNWLEVFYALPLLNPASELVAKAAEKLGYQGGNQAIAFTTTQAADLAEALKGVDAAQAALLTRLAESHNPLVATFLALRILFRALKPRRRRTWAPLERLKARFA